MAAKVAARHSHRNSNPIFATSSLHIIYLRKYPLFVRPVSGELYIYTGSDNSKLELDKRSIQNFLIPYCMSSTRESIHIASKLAIAIVGVRLPMGVI